MRKAIFFTVFLLALISCSDTKIRDQKLAVEIIPTPKEVSTFAKVLVLSADSKIYAENELAGLFKTELSTLTGFHLNLAQSAEEANIVFDINTDFSTDAYQIKVNKTVQVTAGSPQALSMARTTLLQMVQVENKELLFPLVVIRDQPDAKYRGLMIDLARNWHSIETIKKLIDLASYYKSNYIQLHFTDDQSYTLPSIKYPKLSTPERHYSFEDLKELEAYSQARGITIIPEIDIPGHSKSLVMAYPELFGIAAYAKNPYIINMGKEEVYATLEDILSEIIPIFKASPYFHIGGDEAYFAYVMDDPDVKTYMKANDLGDTDVHELYRHFLVRVNDIIKKHGKQTCLWEGFTKEGEVQIPKDIIVFEFETNRYLPNELVADGYTVVNTSWKPIYVVNEKKWEPKTIYEWNMWRWENWWSAAPSIVPIQVEESPLIIGAQMCSWEQPQEIEFASLRKRLPVMNERIWNTKNTISYDMYMKYLDGTDKKLSRLVNDTQQDSLLIGHNHKEPKKVN